MYVPHDRNGKSSSSRRLKLDLSKKTTDESYVRQTAFNHSWLMAPGPYLLVGLVREPSHVKNHPHFILIKYRRKFMTLRSLRRNG
jgi:hypothetical protein